MHLLFDDSVNVSVPVSQGNYSFCNHTTNANAVKYKTVVYFRSGEHKQKISQNNEWSADIDILKTITNAPKTTTSKTNGREGENKQGIL